VTLIDKRTYVVLGGVVKGVGNKVACMHD